MKIPRFLLKPALILAVVAFVLCLITAASPFLGFSEVFASAALVLICGVFPLWLGAVFILSSRREPGRRLKDWVPVLFSGLPRWFIVAFRFYSFSLWLGATGAFILAFRGEKGWLGLGFVLVPSFFYAACIGAYWSEVVAERRAG